MYCEHCGKEIIKDNQFCINCGQAVTQKNEAEASNGEKEFMRRKSWGASLGIWWALFSRAYLYAIIFLIPFVNIFAVVYFILRGREKVWELGRWDDFGLYKQRQEKLDKWAKIIWASLIAIALIIILSVAFSDTSNKSNPYSETPSQTQKVNRIDNSRSVVNILCDNKKGGSGTIMLKDGSVVTNNHVVAGAADCLITIPDPETGAPIEKYVAIPIIVPNLSKQYDIAMLSVISAFTDKNGKSWGEYPTIFPAFVTPSGCGSPAPKLGDSVRVYGYPVTSGGYNLTITDGIVSSFTDDGRILTDAKIDSGNSGGLAVDQNGCILGIPSAVETGNYQNLGVIIPSSIVVDFFNEVPPQSSAPSSETTAPIQERSIQPTSPKTVTTPPPPPPQPTWHTTFTYSGESSTQTAPFRMRGSQWRVTYACTPTAQYAGVLVMIRGEDSFESESFGSGFDDCPPNHVYSFYNHTPGLYYINTSDNNASYSITVEDYY